MITWEETRRFIEAVIGIFAIVNPIGRIMQIFIVAIGAHFVFESIKAIFLPLVQAK